MAGLIARIIVLALLSTIVVTAAAPAQAARPGTGVCTRC